MNEETIALLNLDLADEHGAIIQYLTHAYAMGQGALACEIEAISREEMRHFDWLARAIVSLGGTPALYRGKMRTDGVSVPDWMKNDVFLEQHAIEQYEAHIRQIGDHRVRQVLERILSDEKVHRVMFGRYARELEGEGLADLRGERNDQLAAALNWGIEHEYTALLEYLFQEYTSAHHSMRHIMDDQAVNEMQHMGWLAEKLVEKGGRPRLEFGKLGRPKSASDGLWKAIQSEPEVAARYDKYIRETSDPDVKDLLARIRDHEMYHERVFTDLLKEIQK